MEYSFLCPNDHGYLQIKRKTVLIEICGVHLSHEYEKEAEEDDIPPLLLCPLPTPQLGNYPIPQYLL